jgi:hypothetical protein
MRLSEFHIVQHSNNKVCKFLKQILLTLSNNDDALSHELAAAVQVIYASCDVLTQILRYIIHVKRRHSKLSSNSLNYYIPITSTKKKRKSSLR